MPGGGCGIVMEALSLYLYGSLTPLIIVFPTERKLAPPLCGERLARRPPTIAILVHFYIRTHLAHSHTADSEPCH